MGPSQCASFCVKHHALDYDRTRKAWATVKLYDKVHQPGLPPARAADFPEFQSSNAFIPYSPGKGLLQSCFLERAKRDRPSMDQATSMLGIQVGKVDDTFRVSAQVPSSNAGWPTQLLTLLS
jgi:hypothetical protein